MATPTDIDVGRLRASAHRLAFRFMRPGSVPTPGVHRSIFRGHGLSFAGYREYQHGDDIRLVDWNVTARQNRPMVKLFEQEHASALMIVLDASAFEVAALGTVVFLPFIIFTLPAGVWVDRLPRRPILIAGDLGRAGVRAAGRAVERGQRRRD